MTVDALTPPDIATITGTGPYPIPHEYRDADDFLVEVVDGTEFIELDAADWSVAPQSGASGNLTLSGTAATTYLGKQLQITRATPTEQGWVGQNGAREKGLELQMDMIVMRLQELGLLGSTAFRLRSGAVIPLNADAASRAGRAVSFSVDGMQLVVGPDSDEIQNAQGYAEAASASAQAAAAYAPYPSRAAAIAANVPAPVMRISVIHDGQVLDFVDDGAGTALPTNGGARTWSPAGEITLGHFGAVDYIYDPEADNTDAINAAFAYLRSFEDASLLQRPIVLTGHGRRYRVEGSINATLIRLGKGWTVRDMWLIGRCVGKTVLDLTASRFGNFDNLHVWGGSQFDAASDPHTGILIACADDQATYPCDSHTWNNCSVDGYFSHSAYTEYGSEVTSHTGCIFWNRRTAAGGNPCWAAVLQGRDTVPMVSDYQALGTGRVSYTVKHYNLCRFQKPFGLPGPTMYIEDLASTKFTKPYITNGSGAVITWDLNTDFVPYAIEFDGLQIETTGTDKAFLFTSAVASIFTIYDLKVSFGNIFTDTALFDVSGPSQVVLSNFKLAVPRWQGGTKPTNVFANAGNFRIVGGEISLPQTADMEAYASFVAGSNYRLFGHDSRIWRDYGIERFAAGIPLAADGGINSGKGGILNPDTAVSIDLNALGHGTNGVLHVWSTAAGCAAMVMFRADATPVVLLSTLGTITEVVTATNLTGSTGTDERLTIAINNGQIQFENTRSFPLSYRYFITGFNSSV